MKNSDTTLYSSPFSKGYWKNAAREFSSLRMLVLAAVFVALRVAVKSLKIPVADNLYLGMDMLVNSVGSMVYGPLVGLLVGAVSDTLGAVLFPTGTYFFPFIAVEMLSSFLFGLFLYRARLGEIRIVLARFCVVFLCNLILNPLIMTWYYRVFFDKDYSLFSVPRMVKNAALLPLECLVLVLWLGLISPVTYRLGMTYDKPEELRVTVKGIVSIVLASLVSAGAVLLYVFVYLPNK